MNECITIGWESFERTKNQYHHFIKTSGHIQEELVNLSRLYDAQRQQKLAPAPKQLCGIKPPMMGGYTDIQVVSLKGKQQGKALSITLKSYHRVKDTRNSNTRPTNTNRSGCQRGFKHIMKEHEHMSTFWVPVESIL